MTIRKELRFLDIVVKKTTVEPGTRYDFTVNDVVAGYTFPANATLEALTPDAMRIMLDNPGLKAMSTPLRPIVSKQECVLERTTIDRAYIPSRFPGFKTTFKWTPTPETT